MLLSFCVLKWWKHHSGKMTTVVCWCFPSDNSQPLSTASVSQTKHQGPPKRLRGHRWWWHAVFISRRKPHHHCPWNYTTMWKKAESDEFLGTCNKKSLFTQAKEMENRYSSSPLRLPPHHLLPRPLFLFFPENSRFGPWDRKWLRASISGWRRGDSEEWGACCGLILIPKSP